MTITKREASAPPMIYAMTMENIIIRGARMAVLIIIMYANCTFPTSVVILVTSDEVENLSIFSKANVCTL